MIRRNARRAAVAAKHAMPAVEPMHDEPLACPVCWAFNDEPCHRSIAPYPKSVGCPREPQERRAQ